MADIDGYRADSARAFGALEPWWSTLRATGACGGATVTVKSAALVPVPPGVVTATFPVAAPAGTTAVTCEADTDDGATPTPPNETELAPDRFDPDTVTNVPTGPDVGKNPLTTGAGGGATVTVKSAALLVPVPPGVVTATFPVPAPAGTTAVTCEADTDDGATPTPPNETELAPDRFDPDTVTNVPTGPDVGKNPLTTGTTTT